MAACFVVDGLHSGARYRQGAIRVAVSLIGILAPRSWPCRWAKLVKLLMGSFGVVNPVVLWILGPVIAFVIISAIFKACALPLHQKVDVHYKYHAGDLRLALWNALIPGWAPALAW